MSEEKDWASPRLIARMAGNIASGVSRHFLEREVVAKPLPRGAVETVVADFSVAVARQICRKIKEKEEAK